MGRSYVHSSNRSWVSIARIKPGGNLSSKEKTLKIEKIDKVQPEEEEEEEEQEEEEKKDGEKGKEVAKKKEEGKE